MTTRDTTTPMTHSEHLRYVAASVAKESLKPLLLANIGLLLANALEEALEAGEMSSYKTTVNLLQHNLRVPFTNQRAIDAASTADKMLNAKGYKATPIVFCDAGSSPVVYAVNIGSPGG